MNQSNISKKIRAEREVFISQWCQERGLCSRNVEHYDRAAAYWAFQNCFN